ILDRHSYIIGSLITPPATGQQRDNIIATVTAAMRRARDNMTFPTKAYQHRCASGEGFPTEACGFAFGGGQQTVGNIKPSSKTNTAAMAELLADPNIGHITTHLFPVFQAQYFHIFSDYHTTKKTLLQKNPHLRCTFARSPFAAITANLGPVSVSTPHTDEGNKADGLCLISTLGEFDPDKGRHLVLWDYDLVIRFPPGCSILIPLAVVTHSNTPIQDGDERFSLIQYSAGSLFRWVNNGFHSDLTWKAT
ncbi:hypothetical protein K438DRAFT_1512899, partial [Mycena galopus ATCC 62051]